MNIFWNGVANKTVVMRGLENMPPEASGTGAVELARIHTALYPHGYDENYDDVLDADSLQYLQTIQAGKLRRFDFESLDGGEARVMYRRQLARAMKKWRDKVELDMEALARGVDVAEVMWREYEDICYMSPFGWGNAEVAFTQALMVAEHFGATIDLKAVDVVGLERTVYEGYYHRSIAREEGVRIWAKANTNARATRLFVISRLATPRVASSNR